MVALFMVTVPAWGGPPRQHCLSCHSAHYEEKGKCSDCHLGNPAAGRKNIAHAGVRAGKYCRFTLGNAVQKREGEQLIEQLSCRRCHITTGRGNRLAVSLDTAAAHKTAAELALSIRRPVENMPNFVLNEELITIVVNAIYAGSLKHKTDVETPVQVHFTPSVSKEPDVFSVKCGRCHRVLSRRLGAVGTGTIGPNLSGLFSDYYPKTFKDGEAWTVRNLDVWLKNPRKIRPWSEMMPVTLTAAEMKELMEILSAR